jgi:DNA-damage-inducible protein D
MEKEPIAELFQKSESACYDLDGLKCWIARDLQKSIRI